MGKKIIQSTIKFLETRKKIHTFLQQSLVICFLIGFHSYLVSLQTLDTLVEKCLLLSTSKWLCVVNINKKHRTPYLLVDCILSSFFLITFVVVDFRTMSFEAWIKLIKEKFVV